MLEGQRACPAAGSSRPALQQASALAPRTLARAHLACSSGAPKGALRSVPWASVPAAASTEHACQLLPRALTSGQQGTDAGQGCELCCRHSVLQTQRTAGAQRLSLSKAPHQSAQAPWNPCDPEQRLQPIPSRKAHSLLAVSSLLFAHTPSC